MGRERVIVEGVTKAVLVVLAAGAVITVALAAPGIGYLYKVYRKDQWEEAKRRGVLKTTIKRLEKQKLVSWSEQNGATVLTLTEDGRKKILKYKIDDLKINKPKKWDGLWRVIIFDIPEKERIAREMFRNKLKDLEFSRLQKSVFIYPFECKDEIDFLRYALEIDKYVIYMEVKKIHGLEVKFSRFINPDDLPSF